MIYNSIDIHVWISMLLPFIGQLDNIGCQGLQPAK